MNETVAESKCRGKLSKDSNDVENALSMNTIKTVAEEKCRGKLTVILKSSN